MFTRDKTSLKLIKAKAGQEELIERGNNSRWNPALPSLIDAQWKETY